MNVIVGIFKRTFLGGIVFLLPFLPLFLLAPFLAFFLTSCAWFESFENPDANPNQPPVLEPTKFKILLIDTPRVKFYDFASFRYNKTSKKLNIELYKLGKPVSEIVITPKDEGKRVSNDGTLFVQWFVRGGQEFYYERSKNKVLFKNLSANITIGIEDYILPSSSTN